MRGQIAGLTTTAGVRAIKGGVTATMKKRTMDAAKAFAASAKNITTWAEKDKRERAKGEQLGSMVAGPASSPLCQALLAVVEACDSGALNLGSVFEAKAGIRPSLIIPTGDTDPVVAIQRLPFAKQSTKAVAVYLQKEQWGVVPVSPANAKKLEKVLAKSYDAVMRSSLPLPAHGVVAEDLSAAILWLAAWLQQHRFLALLLHGDTGASQRFGSNRWFPDGPSAW